MLPTSAGTSPALTLPRIGPLPTHLLRLKRSPPPPRQPAQRVQPPLVLQPLPELPPLLQRARRSGQPLAAALPAGLGHQGDLL